MERNRAQSIERPELPSYAIDNALDALEKAPFESWRADGVSSTSTRGERLVIRTAGDPRMVFSDDPLQILRGCLLVSRFGCEIEPFVLQTMKSHKLRLVSSPIERVAKAIDEFLLGNYVHDALVETVDVLVAVMPEIAACRGFDQHTPYHIYDVWEHIAWVVQYSPALSLSRWSALFHDIGKPAACFMEGTRAHFYGHAALSATLARGIVERFNMEPSFGERIVTLVRMHDDIIPATPESVQSVLETLGSEEMFRALCHLKRADALAHSDLAAPRVQRSHDLERILNEFLGQK